MSGLPGQLGDERRWPLRAWIRALTGGGADSLQRRRGVAGGNGQRHGAVAGGGWRQEGDRAEGGGGELEAGQERAGGEISIFF